MIATHALIAVDANDRGMFRAVCRCGHVEYASSADEARRRLHQHVDESGK